MLLVGRDLLCGASCRIIEAGGFGYLLLADIVGVVSVLIVSMLTVEALSKVIHYNLHCRCPIHFLRSKQAV